MAITLGHSTQREVGTDVLARSRARAALLPDLLVEAQRVANTVSSGLHGRRRRGSGDTFWQFRPYDPSEGLSRIDWRRSARDDSVYVRDQEWEAAHTVWVWADDSPSMLYKSQGAQVSKQSRGLVLALALLELLAKSGERVGWPGVTNAMSHRNSAERIAAQLAVIPATTSPFPPTEQCRARTDIVLISDFLEPVEETLTRLDAIAQQGVRGILVQIIDPAEEQFPFSGRTEFQDPESGDKLTYGRAETLLVDYRNLFVARREALAQHCKRLNWDHIVHHTDTLASGALVSLHERLTANIGTGS